MNPFSNLLSSLQKIGQALMVPVSVLPAAGLLVALGRLFKNTFMGDVLYTGGLAVFEQLPLVFAIGVAIGFSGQAGVAGLSAAVGYFTFINVLKVWSEHLHLTLAINTGVFGGILVGAFAAYSYKKFHQIQLPAVLGFFSGKRFVPIFTALGSFLIAVSMGILWPSIQQQIYDFGKWVIGSEFGPALYAAGKRLLIPVGLHHVYYPPFLFEFGEFVTSAGQVVKGETARYFAGDVQAGNLMASEFPIMLFGLPAAALAMYMAAPLEKRKWVGGMMLSAALTSILTGITEPIEFSFIFVAPLLYVLHVGFAFVSGYLVHLFDIHLGYTFSASAIDFVLGFFNQKNSMYLFLVVGPLVGIIYFSTFYTLIRKFDFKTPGREAEDDVSSNKIENPLKIDSYYPDILLALGGAKNITSLDACITRLRLSVNDSSLIDEKELKKLGASGVMKSGPAVQVVFGVKSDQIKEELKKIISIYAIQSPLKGKLSKLDFVEDKVFSDKILGDGFAIDPTSNVVCSPFNGEVVTVFPTQHAIGLKSDNGLELLIHVGINTVELKGKGFSSLVKEGQKIQCGQALIEFDSNYIRSQGKSLITPIIFTNSNQIKSFDISMDTNITTQDIVAWVDLNEVEI